MSTPRTDSNPYAPPSIKSSFGNSLGASSEGVWSDGKVLHIEKGATLPARCVRCNAPAQARVHRKLYWHSPWYALTIFAGLITYAIVAVIVRKKLELDIGLCDEHARRRRNVIAIAWSATFACIAAALFGPDSATPLLTFLSILLFVVAAVVGQRQANVLAPLRIDDQRAKLRGAGAQFLDSLERRAA